MVCDDPVPSIRRNNMEKLDIRSLKARARQTLEQTKPDYRKLVLYHGALSAGVMILISLLQLLVGIFDTNTGGLDGLGTGAMINTTLSLLNSASSIVLPFWQIGILFTSLQVVRKKRADFPMLAEGFRRFAPLLRYGILLFGILFAVIMGYTYVIFFYMMLIPPPHAVMEAVEPFAQQELPVDSLTILKAMPSEFWKYMIVPMILYLILMVSIVLPIYYRLRMGQYVIMDDEHAGARYSMGLSNTMTNGYKWDLCKLDFSFWWYYILQILVLLIADIPLLLQIANITLPFSLPVASIIFYLIYTAALLLLLYFAGAYVETTYACAYDFLLSRNQAMAPVFDPPIAPQSPETEEASGELLAIPESQETESEPPQ